MGGLQLTNILLSDKALKLSCLRRICNQTEGLASFPHYYKIDKAIFYGSIYIENIEENMENPFLLDVVQAIKLLWEKFYPTNHTERLATPLWLSKEIFAHNSKDIVVIIFI